MIGRLRMLLAFAFVAWRYKRLAARYLWNLARGRAR